MLAQEQQIPGRAEQFLWPGEGHGEQGKLESSGLSSMHCTQGVPGARS